MHPEVLDIDGAAEALRLSRKATYAKAQSGQIPGCQIGTQWRFWRPAVLQAVMGDCVLATHPMTPVDDPEMIDRVTLASLLDIHPRTCGNLMRAGAIPAHRLGSTWRIWWPDVRDMMITGGLPSSTPQG